MWNARDPVDNKVTVNIGKYTDDHVSDLLPYCRCANKVGVELVTCCYNDGMQFQYDGYDEAALISLTQHSRAQWTPLQ